MGQIHEAAQQGFSRESRSYARGRPEYPEEILRWLGDVLGLSATSKVLDLGAGTGKFTKLLARTGARVQAVEPVAAMREQFALDLPAVSIVAGDAEAIPLGNASVDAVLCAQAFHWFASEAALGEIHRVLQPGGRLGLIWNVRDETVDWVAAITAIISPYEGNAPRFYKGEWRRPFKGRYFSDPQPTPFSYQHVGHADEVILDRFLSVSFIASLPDTERAKVKGRLQDLIASHPALRGQATIAFPYQTLAYVCDRLD